jgi:hypothetical protein
MEAEGRAMMGKVWHVPLPTWWSKRIDRETVNNLNQATGNHQN